MGPWLAPSGPFRRAGGCVRTQRPPPAYGPVSNKGVGSGLLEVEPDVYLVVSLMLVSPKLTAIAVIITTSVHYKD